MPVTVKEYVKLTDLEGKAHEGVGVANNLAAIEEDGNIVYGVVTSMVKVRTTVVCDNKDCVNSEVNDKFQTVPRTIEFDDNGDNSAEFIKKLSEIVITSDYKGEKQAYCSAECYAAMVRKEHRSKLVAPNGMRIIHERNRED